MHYMKRPRIPDEPRLLPLDWKAGECTVFIGRGRRCIHNEGNRRFRAMVKEELQTYSVGRKAKKSSIIKRILREINSRNDDGIGFVKQDAMTGRYYTATVTAAKVTIAQAFRDALHDIGYKSSKQHKQFKRDIARGKVDPDGYSETSLARVCSTCNEEVNLQQDVDTAPTQEEPEPVSVTSPCKPTATANIDGIPKAPGRMISAETPSQFWGDCIDPLVEFEHSNPQAAEEPSAARVFGDVNFAQLCGCGVDHSSDERAAVPVEDDTKVVDPFEPLPLEQAATVDMSAPVEGVAVWERAAPAEGIDDSETSGSSQFFLDSDDDEEDHAMVAWAAEFVHCPRCSLVEGRNDFQVGNLPIQEIRKQLIGLQ